MNHQEKLAFIRGKCVEANPGVVNGSIGVCVNGTYVEKRKTTRTICLADVLLAIKAKDITVEKRIEEAAGREGCKSAMFYQFLQAWSARESRIDAPCFWNLRKDDLNEQDEATISFLYDVLR